MSRFAVLDFETTGLSIDEGARATEIAIVITEHGRVVDRFQSLMNAGVRIPPFIADLTGITDAMVADAPPAAVIMRQAARFVGDTPLVAHNAGFDRRFWCSELERAGMVAAEPFICTLLLARRIYPQAPRHALGPLLDHLELPRTGTAHRALADAEMAASLLARIRNDLRSVHGIARPDRATLLTLQSRPRTATPSLLRRLSANAG